MIYRFPASLRIVSVSPDELGLDPALGDVFLFESVSSNNSLDFYYTHMLESSLRNFAADAASGVQFLDSHNNTNLGYGRTVAGRFEETDEPPDFGLPAELGLLAFTPPERAQQAIFTTMVVPGINFGGGLTYASTDDFIKAARAGIARDISIGFYGGSHICDICGGDYRRYDTCPHFAGIDYGIEERGDRQVLATVSIDGARLAEHSAVYDGATPGAEIRKAQDLARLGELPPEHKLIIEARYKVELPSRSQFSNYAPRPEDRTEDTGETITRSVNMNFEEIVTEVRQVLAESPVPAERDGEELSLAAQVRELVRNNARLTSLADDGRQYRDDLIAEAIAEGTRALGSDFAVETYRATLETSSLATIKRMRDDWSRIADKRFPGGRATSNDEERSERPSPSPIPDAAYRV